uniref:non-specific serine/threonine protein kinase n=1 Tax=Oryza barthii TaxID=65489 RepID=A0A0D3EX97_9ORYZ
MRNGTAFFRFSAKRLTLSRLMRSGRLAARLSTTPINFHAKQPSMAVCHGITRRRHGIDIYFENVGGPMLDVVLLNMRTHGRIAVCGMVSQNALTDPVGIHNIYCLVPEEDTNARLHPERPPPYVPTVKHYRDGKIVYVEDMSIGLENAPAAFVGLFSGKNVGKQVAFPSVSLASMETAPTEDLDTSVSVMSFDTGLLFWLLLLSSSSLCFGSELDIQCLKSVKRSLIDPSGILRSSWKFSQDGTTNSICNFMGVICWNPDENRILGLSLGSLGLQGQFPRGLEHCTSLVRLDLSNNSLSGPIPSGISWQLPDLSSLNLSYNRFSGEIPVNISEMTYLYSIGLQHNKLTGSIPGKFALLSRTSYGDYSIGIIGAAVGFVVGFVGALYISHCLFFLRDAPALRAVF